MKSTVRIFLLEDLFKYYERSVSYSFNKKIKYKLTKTLLKFFSFYNHI